MPEQRKKFVLSSIFLQSEEELMPRIYSSSTAKLVRALLEVKASFYVHLTML